MENALAKGVPVAISFLANLIGLGGIAKKVQEIIKKVRKSIDKIIGKVVGVVVDKAKILIAKMKDVAGNLKEKVTDKKVTDDGKSMPNHKMYAEEIAADLKKDDGKDDKSFEEFYKKKVSLATALKKKYQPKLEKGIFINIEMNDLAKSQADNDVDFQIIIAPNTTKLSDKYYSK